MKINAQSVVESLREQPKTRLTKANILLAVAALLISYAVFGNYVPGVKAQNPVISPSYETVAANTPHTNCPVMPGVTAWCKASDGLWESDAGGAWFKLGASNGTGVTSFNGRTGAVVSIAGDYKYTDLSGSFPGVTSFNGRTGTVTPVFGDYGYSLLSGTVPVPKAFSCGAGAITFSNCQ